MSQSDIDVIYKSLRLLPEFDGNSHVLTRFINLCDQIVLQHCNPAPGHELANLALINGILNKVTGNAARLINSNGIPENWQGIRSALINNFADHRDETALYSDLSIQTQGSSTPQEFYERCQNLFSTIMTYISLHEAVPTTVQAKRDLYQKLTLQAYLRGLKDPLGCRIRCMRPATMEQALEFVQEELNTLYLQQRNEVTSIRKDGQQPPAPNLPLNNFIPKSIPFGMPMKPSGFSIPIQQRPPPAFYQPPQGWKPNFQPPRGLTRTQQIMRAPPPNYNPQSHVFRMPFKPQQSFNKPQPMSGVSHYVPKHLPLHSTGQLRGHDWSKHGNPPPTNYFKTREAHFNEFDGNEYDQGNYYDYDYVDYDPNYYGYEYVEYPPHQEQYTYPEVATVEEVDPNTELSEDTNFHKASNSEKPA